MRRMYSGGFDGWSGDCEYGKKKYIEQQILATTRNCSKFTSYVAPLSVPASQGYKSTTLLSSQLQSDWHSSNADTPTNQSGDGDNIDTNDTKWFSESTRNTANVLPVIFGYDKPRALIIVRMLSLCSLFKKYY